MTHEMVAARLGVQTAPSFAPLPGGYPRIPEDARMHDDVKEAAANATDFIRRQADKGSKELGGRLNAVADGLESSSDEFHDREKDVAASVARYLAFAVRRAGAYLEHTDTATMAEDARDYARTHPWLVIAAGFAAGFALSRAIKNAASEGGYDV
jgi:ElaB/YqjD/DUF883 family membrane-anchored ribosome-binding protein